MKLAVKKKKKEGELCGCNPAISNAELGDTKISDHNELIQYGVCVIGLTVPHRPNGINCRHIMNKNPTDYLKHTLRFYE
jgi:hypothetical protein